MDAEQLEKMMGFAPGELEKAAEAYEKDRQRGQAEPCAKRKHAAE